MKTAVICIVLVATCASAEWREHWAFQPVARPELPGSSSPANTPIDAFLLDELASDGLTLAPKANRLTWFRRLHFSLTGLAPSEMNARQFLEDCSIEAEERWIDRLLASPAYGERRAQVWLDLARFAESDGFEFDHIRKEAWRYRDLGGECLQCRSLVR